MTAFQPGQTVTGRCLIHGELTGTVIRQRRSILDSHIQIVDIDVDGMERHLRADECRLVEENPMTQTAMNPNPPHEHSSAAISTPEAGAPQAADLSPAPEGQTLTTGWWRKGSGPAHWLVKGKAVCGREVFGEVVITTADPAAQEYQRNQCRKCAGWLEKHPVQDPAPAEQGAAPETADLESTPQAPTPILAAGGPTQFRPDQLFPSPLNPRRHFDPPALQELAESILHKGLMQNLVGRLAPDGRVEVVAGGRRLRAVLALAEDGRLPEGFMVPVLVQPMSDLEALQLATAENVERRSMTPLEEADAFAQMVELGADPKEIALRFGFSEKTVQQRLVLAQGLGDDGRKLYDEGKISLRAAQIIAQTSGPLRKHVLEHARAGSDAGHLAWLIEQRAFPVGNAKFDVAGSGLEIVEDLFGDQPPRFADSDAALALQLDWAKARAAELAGKKEQYFAEVATTNTPYVHPSGDHYTDYDVPKNLYGTVIVVSTVTGELKQFRRARMADAKSARAKKQADNRRKSASEAMGGESGGAIRKSAFEDGHKARAGALRDALFSDHRRTVALGIMALLGAYSSHLWVNENNHHNLRRVETPALATRLRELDAKLGGLLQTSYYLDESPRHRGYPVSIAWRSSARDSSGEYDYLRKLLILSLEELLDLHGILVALTYGGWSEHNPQHAPDLIITRLAADVGATVRVKLTDEHLKAYPKDRLLELARDAGLDYIADNVAKYPTNTALRGAILEMADDLYERGYVPPICRFPEPDPKELAQEQADEQFRQQALALIPRLNDEQLLVLATDVFEEVFDGAEEPTEADFQELREHLTREIQDTEIGELRDWEALGGLLTELGPAHGGEA